MLSYLGADIASQTDRTNVATNHGTCVGRNIGQLI